MFAIPARFLVPARNIAAGLLTATIVLLTPAARGTASAEETYVEAPIGPPPARAETIPARPSPRHFWVSGYWTWDGSRHTWVPGHYVLERRGFAYVQPRWQALGTGHFRYYPGGWIKR